MLMGFVSSLVDAFITALVPVAFFAVAHTCLLLCALFIWSCRLVSSIASAIFQVVDTLSHLQTKSLDLSALQPQTAWSSTRQLAFRAIEHLADIATNTAALVTKICIPPETDAFLDKHCPTVQPSTLSLSQSSGERICTICIDKMPDAAQVRQLRCAHMFHS